MKTISMTWVRHVILDYNHNFIFGSWFILGWNKEYVQEIRGPEKAGAWPGL